MKPCLTILVLAGVLMLLASIAVALLFSIGVGRSSWILAAILVLDSLALFLIGACVLLRRNHRNCA